VLSKLFQASQRLSSLIRRGLRQRRRPNCREVAAHSPSRREAAGKGSAAPRYPMASTSDYYQHVHQTNSAYQTNNWLVSEVDSILAISPRSILEVGCGNGRFLAAVKGRVELAIGVDWARSPILDEIGMSAHFALCDITRDELPKADLVCSADVLEHIAPHLLRPTVERLNRAGADQYHVIACYDDGHSHLSIMDPRDWLDLFQSVSPRFQIVHVRPRRDDPSQKVCVIATFHPEQQLGQHRGVQAATAPPSVRAP
jgi:hypothetical protein